MLELALFVFAHYVGIAVFVGLAYVAGRSATARIEYASGWERFGLSATVGFGILALAVFAIGLAGWLYPAVLLGAGAIILVVGRTAAREAVVSLRDSRWRIWSAGGLTVALVALAALPILVFALYPPTQFDAVMYHLAYAKIYATGHQITYTPYLRLPVFPQTFEMLYTAMVVLVDDVAAQLVHAAALGLILVLLYSWGTRAFSPRAGLWAALLCLASPLIVWNASSAYIDVGLALFATAAIYALHTWLTERRTSWLLLSAVLTGFAAGTKYTGLTTGLILGVLVLAVSVRTKDLRPAISFGLVAGLVMAPFYLRNFYYTGNPIWPFLGEVFGYGPWTLDDYRSYVASLYLGAPGVGKDPAGLLSLPWTLFANPMTFQNAVSIVSPIHLVLVPGLLVGLVRGETRLLALIAGCSFLFWFLTVQDSRYLLPVFPLASLLAAVGVARAVSVPRPRVQILGRVAVPAAFCVAFAFVGARQVRPELASRGYVPTTAPARHAYLAARLRPYAAVQWLNEHADAYRAYQIHAENVMYFFDDTVMGDWFGERRYTDVLVASTSGQELYDKLRSFGVSHLLVDTRRFQVRLPEDAAFKQRFSRVYNDRGTSLYELLHEDG